MRVSMEPTSTLCDNGKYIFIFILTKVKGHELDSLEICSGPKAHVEPCQTSKMEPLVEVAAVSRYVFPQKLHTTSLTTF